MQMDNAISTLGGEESKKRDKWDSSVVGVDGSIYGFHAGVLAK